MTGITYRQLTDVEDALQWRIEAITDVFGRRPLKDMEQIKAANHMYLEKHMAEGTHIAVVASCDDADLGCGAVCLYDELPSPDNTSGICAFLMSVYVRPQYRGNGVGSGIVRWLIGRAKDAGAGKIYLESTEMAKSLYGKTGFIPMNNMMKLWMSRD